MCCNKEKGMFNFMCFSLSMEALNKVQHTINRANAVENITQSS